MTIIRNSAKCVDCGEEIESTSRHDFVAHFCKVAPAAELDWKDGRLAPTGKSTWSFAVDGGRNYIRRAGSGFVDTSEVTE